MIKQGLIVCSMAASLSAQAQTLDVDWLYLSNNGSWISRSETMLKEQGALKLPVASLNSDQFYWHADDPQTQLIWQTPHSDFLPTKGSSVAIQNEPGFWLVQAVSPSHLVLQQGKTVRYWPQSQWHLLEWTSSQDYGLTLQIQQPEQQRNRIFYAWQTPMLSAEVTYRLEDRTLYQELIVSNQSEETYLANGYSFARNQSRPMLTTAMRTMALKAESKIGTPTAGESQGIPTLYSDTPVQLSAGSNVWLPITQAELDSVKRHYQVTWDSRQSGLQKAQMQLVLAGKALPDIPGNIKVGVFDKQLAIQSAYYQPQSAKEARLDLGQSALVSMTSQTMRDGHWRLILSNRSQEEAEVELTISHWDGKQSKRSTMIVSVKADSEKNIDLELTSNDLKRPKTKTE